MATTTATVATGLKNDGTISTYDVYGGVTFTQTGTVFVITGTGSDLYDPSDDTNMKFTSVALHNNEVNIATVGPPSGTYSSTVTETVLGLDSTGNYALIAQPLSPGYSLIYVISANGSPIANGTTIYPSISGSYTAPPKDTGYPTQYNASVWLDTGSWANGITVNSNEWAVLTGVVQNTDGSYTVQSSDYDGTLRDGWGTTTASETQNVVSISLQSLDAAYGTTSSPGVIEWDYNYQDGSISSVPSGGEVVAWSSNGFLVEGLSNFVDNGDGTYDSTGLNGTYSWVSANDISEVDNGGQPPASLPLEFDPFNAAGPTYSLFPCYVEGTRIRTVDGDVAVEDLKPGDLLAVYTQQGILEQPVVWIGHRRVNIAAHPQPELVQPIRIRRDAFAAGQPSRDLLVSPDHAIHVDGMLIPAKVLINGGSIVREQGWTSVVYYHVELAQHSVIYAEDLPAESYLDTGNRAVFENAGGLMMLHPDFSISAHLQQREAGSCLPFVVTPLVVRPLWFSLMLRSGLIGHPTAVPQTLHDPKLRLRTATRAFRPLSQSDQHYVFIVPAHTQEVRLVSRAAPPCLTQPWIDDGRQLGVRIGRITLKDGNHVSELPLDGPWPTEGWWALETDGMAMARWTNGNATLRLPPGGETARVPTLHLAGSTAYPLEQTADEVLPPLKVA